MRSPASSGPDSTNDSRNQGNEHTRMTITTYTVAGMTCEHCVTAVGAELGSVPGVTDVVVELHPSQHSLVSVTSVAPLAAQTVAAAIDEAGYQLIAG